MSTEYTFAMLGAGKRGHRSSPGIAAEPRARVTAIADINREAAEKLKAEYGFDEANIYTDHMELLDSERPDVVVLSLWTPLHLPVFRDCVERGVRLVMCEKPMAPTWGEALEMARLAEAGGTDLTFCHQRRYHHGNLAVRGFIEEGLLGEVKRMDLYSPCDLLDCGTHSFDQAASFNFETPARWVLGAADISEVGEHYGIPSEAMFAGLVVYENDVRAYIQSKGPDRDMGTGIRVEGTKGLIEVGWNGQIGRAVLFDDPGWKPHDFASEEDNSHVMADVYRDTLDRLEDGAEPLLSYKKALRSAEIIFALYESARRRERIELPLDTPDASLAALLEDARHTHGAVGRGATARGAEGRSTAAGGSE